MIQLVAAMRQPKAARGSYITTGVLDYFHATARNQPTSTEAKIKTDLNKRQLIEFREAFTRIRAICEHAVVELGAMSELSAIIAGDSEGSDYGAPSIEDYVLAIVAHAKRLKAENEQHKQPESKT